ncbi:MAG: response regulator [Candidatus Dojkabacteria bacterium]
MNILICEDDIDIQDLLEIIISSMDIGIHQCNDKTSLYEKLKKEKIDLIILDYWLKKKRADEIIEKIKTEYSSIPVILMSAVSDLPELAKKLNADDYIKKPFNIDELKDKITTILNI